MLLSQLAGKLSVVVCFLSITTMLLTSAANLAAYAASVTVSVASAACISSGRSVCLLVHCPEKKCILNIFCKL